MYLLFVSSLNNSQRIQQSMGQPDMGANPARGQLNRDFFLPWESGRSCETSSAVPSRTSPPILPTQAESSIINHQSSIILVLTHGIPPNFREGVHLSYHTVNRHRVNPEIYQVTQLRTDGAHRRESTRTRDSLSNGCCLFGQPHETVDVRLFSPAPTKVR